MIFDSQKMAMISPQLDEIVFSKGLDFLTFTISEDEQTIQPNSKVCSHEYRSIDNFDYIMQSGHYGM